MRLFYNQGEIILISNALFLLTILFVPALGLTQNSLSQKSWTKPAPQVSAMPPLKMADLPTPQTDQDSLRVLQGLIEQSGWFSKIQVQVRNGMVLISGEAPGKEELEWLAAAADRLPHVLAVINKAEVSVEKVSDLGPMWNEAQRLIERTKRGLPKILVGLALLIGFVFLGRYLGRGVRNLWARQISNPFLVSTVSRLTLLPIWLLFFYLVLQALGLSGLGTTIIGGTGILGIVLGLAFKGIAENYLAGLLLASRSPFTKGDLIKINEFEGYVQNLNMSGTTIIDLNGNLILIPNLTVIQSVVENQTANPKTRTSFNVTIAYEHSITKAQELIITTMMEVKGVLPDPAPNVIVSSLDSSGVNLKVLIWFNVKISNEPRVLSRCMTQTKEVLLSHGISLPDPDRERIIADPIQIRMYQSNEDANSAAAERKSHIKQQAAENLQETREIPAAEDTYAQDLMKLAEANPLPGNASRLDLLKKQ